MHSFLPFSNLFHPHVKVGTIIWPSSTQLCVLQVSATLRLVQTVSGSFLSLICSVRITGGLVVAIFQYISDKSLYELMVMEGTVEVFRGGETMVLNQIDVVPGDIVRLVVSVATCVYSPQVLASAPKNHG